MRAVVSTHLGHTARRVAHLHRVRITVHGEQVDGRAVHELVQQAPPAGRVRAPPASLPFLWRDVEMGHGVPPHHEDDVGVAHAQLRVRTYPQSFALQPAVQVVMVGDLCVPVVSGHPHVQ